MLTKIIDAREALSVQVHPDDAYAQRVEHQPNGKTECWYVLDCEPGAELVLGWTRDTTRDEYERRVADGTLGDILRRVPVTPGDAFYLPAGTLHAIGAGIQLFETQQASDLTYRIFDWNRVGADGKPRELHVQKAGDVLDFRATFRWARCSSFRSARKASSARCSSRTRGSLVERVTRDARRSVRRHRRLAADDHRDGRAPARRLAGDRRTGRARARAVAEHGDPGSVRAHRADPGGEPTSALLVHPQPNLAKIRERALAAGVAPSDTDAFFAQFV